MRKLVVIFCFLFPFTGMASSLLSDTLRNTSRDRYTEVAGKVFLSHLIRMDSASAIKEFNTLISSAKSQGDHHLLALGLSLKGRYYDYRLDNGHQEGILLMEQAVNVSEQFGPDDATALYVNHLGFALCKRMKYQEGLSHLLRSNHMMQEIGYERIPEIDVCLYKLARVYIDFENYEQVIHFAKQALKYSDENSPTRHAANNLLGASYAELEQIDEAMVCFNKTLRHATEISDSLGIGSAYCNLGMMHIMKKEYEKGASLLQQSYDMNRRLGIWMNAVASLLGLAEIDMVLNQMEAAGYKLNEVLKLMTTHNITEPESWKTFYELQSGFHKRNGQYELTSAYLDSLIGLEDSIRKKRDIRLLSNLSVQIAAEKYLTDIRLLEKDKILQNVIRNSIVLIATIVILILLILWYFSVKKRRKEQKEFLAAREKAKRELEIFKKRITDKNQLLENLREQMENVHNNIDQKAKEDMIRQLDNFTILTEDDWLEFKRLFDQVYPNFIKDIQLKNPTLSSAEIRLLTLIKLNLSVGEMANTLGILPESVRKTRQRLMKKLDISYHKELPSFVQKF